MCFVVVCQMSSLDQAHLVLLLQVSLLLFLMTKLRLQAVFAKQINFQCSAIFPKFSRCLPFQHFKYPSSIKPITTTNLKTIAIVLDCFLRNSFQEVYSLCFRAKHLLAFNLPILDNLLFFLRSFRNPSLDPSTCLRKLLQVFVLVLSY